MPGDANDLEKDRTRMSRQSLSDCSDVTFEPKGDRSNQSRGILHKRISERETLGGRNTPGLGLKGAGRKCCRYRSNNGRRWDFELMMGGGGVVARAMRPNILTRHQKRQASLPEIMKNRSVKEETQRDKAGIGHGAEGYKGPESSHRGLGGRFGHRKQKGR